MRGIQKVFILLLMFSANSCSFFYSDNVEWLDESEYSHFHLSEFNLLEHNKVWDEARHNAFPDVVEYKEYVYVVLREASCCHFSHDGVVRIIRSKDLSQWENVGKLEVHDMDLRDPMINHCSDNRLCINATGRKLINEKKEEYTYRTFIWNSSDGDNWSKANPIISEGYWLWRYRWTPDQRQALGFAYKTNYGNHINLYRSNDGINFELSIYEALRNGRPNEADLVFIDDSTAISLVRRRSKDKAFVGFSRAPYMEWEWLGSNLSIASPNLIQLPDKRILAGVRLYNPRRTSIVLLDPVNVEMHEVLKLPSGGSDTGYPGMIIRKGELLVVYYSSHEWPTSIYMSKIKLD